MEHEMARTNSHVQFIVSVSIMYLIDSFLCHICVQAYDVALIGKKAGCRDELTVQDFNFMTRKDTRRYERLKVREGSEENVRSSTSW